MNQQIADMAMDIARQQVQIANLAAYLCYTIIGISAVIILNFVWEMTKNAPDMNIYATRAMLDSHVAYSRKKLLEFDAMLAGQRTTVLGHRALNEKQFEDIKSSLDNVHEKTDSLNNDHNRYINVYAQDIKRINKNIGVLDRRTKKKEKAGVKASEYNKIYEESSRWTLAQLKKQEEFKLPPDKHIDQMIEAAENIDKFNKGDLSFVKDKKPTAKE